MEWFRMANFVGMVVLASFNAQSFGYFIGAILMENVSGNNPYRPKSGRQKVVQPRNFLKTYEFSFYDYRKKPRFFSDPSASSQSCA